MITRYLYVYLIIISLVTIAVYWPGLNGPLIFDDHNNLRVFSIYENGGFTLWDIVTNNQSGRFGRPVSMASFTFNYLLSGSLDTWALKFTNLILHIINAWLIYFIFSRVLKGKLANDMSREVAFFIAGVWLFLPIHMSTVLYVIQRMAQLSTFFILLGCCFYIVFRQNQIQKCFRKYYFLAGVVLSGIAAIFSKENGILLPVFLLLIEYFFFSFKGFSYPSEKIKKIIFVLLMILVLIIVLYLVFGHPSFINYSQREYTLLERLLTQARVIFRYIYEIFLPTHSNTAIYSDDFKLSKSIIDPVSTLLSVVGLLLLLSCCYLKRKHATNSLIIFGVLFFFAGHLLESTIINLDMYYEHRNYLPSIGLVMALVIFFYDTISNYLSIKTIRLLLILYMGFLALSTYISANVWSTYPSLVANALQVHPNSTRALNDYSALLMNYGRFEDSMLVLDQSIRVKPQRVSTRMQRFITYCELADSIPDVEYLNLAVNLNSYEIKEATSIFAVLLEQVKAKKCEFLDVKKLAVIWFSAIDRWVAQGERTYGQVLPVEGFLIALLLEVGENELAQPRLERYMKVRSQAKNSHTVDYKIRN